MSRRESLHNWGKDPAEQIWLANWKAWGLPYCSVYVIAPEGHWPSKVGISVHARKRVQELQTSHWKRLVVSECYWCPTVKGARAVEKKVHDALKEENVYLLGEWFDKTPAQAAEIVGFTAMVLGVELNGRIEHEGVLRDVTAYAEEQRSIYNATWREAFHTKGGKYRSDGPVVRIDTKGRTRVVR
jgi:hypothetical protein